MKNTIYCLMVTGLPERLEWARIAVRNFLKQDYPYKKLIIINHNLKANVFFRTAGRSPPNIDEYIVSKKGKTLGDLRNISLQYVPAGSFFYIWDDDDERHPTMLTVLMNAAILNNAKYVLTKNRLNFNCVTNSLWRSTDVRGMYPLFGYKSGKPSEDFSYLKKDTMEDSPVNELSKKKGTVLLDNDPRLYVRFTHGNNTSPFVKKNQTMATLNMGPYIESVATESDKEYIEIFIKDYDRVCNVIN